MTSALKKEKQINNENETMAEVVVMEENLFTNLCDNVHHRKKSSKDSMVGDNVHQHNYEDEMCIY